MRTLSARTYNIQQVGQKAHVKYVIKTQKTFTCNVNK